MMSHSSSGGVGQQPIEAELRCLNSELWHACVGPLVSLPVLGSRVVYFPQGRSEQKWSEFLLSGVALELRSRVPYENAQESMQMDKMVHTNKKDFVAFEIDSVHERLPFLLSRDFAFVRPSDKTKLFKLQLESMGEARSTATCILELQPKV